MRPCESETLALFHRSSRKEEKTLVKKDENIVALFSCHKEFCVHTRCSRYDKGEDLFNRNKCKWKLLKICKICMEKIYCRNIWSHHMVQLQQDAIPMRGKENLPGTTTLMESMDRSNERKAFDELKNGMKGLVVFEITEILAMFREPPTIVASLKGARASQQVNISIVILKRGSTHYKNQDLMTKAKHERQRLEPELELAQLMQELRTLRIEKLKKQGRFLPKEDEKFFESVRATVEQEETQTQSLANTEIKDSIIAFDLNKKISSFTLNHYLSQRGSYNKAIQFMKESCSRRVQGTMFVNVAAVFKDIATKQRYLCNAIDSARKVVELSPNSIEFGLFYANLLYEPTNNGFEGGAYESLIVQECHIALSIENPIQDLVQNRRPNEIKKATKTLEEGRKEIKVRVTAAKLLQQKSESSPSDTVNNKGSEPTLSAGQRSGVRRKHGNAWKNYSTSERRDRVMLYRESTCKEKKKDLLKVKKHIGNMLPKLQMALPKLQKHIVDNLPAVVKLLWSQQKIQNTEFNELHVGDYMDDGDDYFEDAWNDISPVKRNLGDTIHMVSSTEGNTTAHMNTLHQRFCHALNLGFSDEKEKKWEYTDMEIQRQVVRALVCILGYKNRAVVGLAANVVTRLIRIVHPSFLQSCFLVLVETFSPLLSCQQMKVSIPCIIALNATLINERETKEKEGWKILENAKTVASIGGNLQRISEGNVSVEWFQEMASLTVKLKDIDNVSSGADDVLSWILTGSSGEEETASWMRTVEEKTNQELQIMQILEKEVCYLQNFCERKCEHPNYRGALQTVKQGRKRETSAEFTHDSYESVLRRRREELNETDSFIDLVIQKHKDQLSKIIPNYMQIFLLLLSPDSWKKSGNVPALVRLLQAFLQKSPHEVTLQNQLGEAIRVIYMELENSIHQTGNETRSNTRSLSVQIIWALELLENNLDGKKRTYRDPFLCLLFMMNNGKYILNKVTDNDLGSILGEDWTVKYAEKLRQYHFNFRRSSWNQVVGLLRTESPYPELIKNLRLVNARFDEVCLTQSQWVVTDEQLREELRNSVARIVSPAYLSFIGRLKASPVINGRRGESFIAYTVEDLELRIKVLFKVEFAIWNSMLEIYTAIEDYKKTVQVYQRIKEAGLEPDETTYNTLIIMYYRNKRLEEGYLLVSKIAALHEVSSEACELKEKGDQVFESQVEDLKLVIKARYDEKYEKILEEARHEIDVFVSIVEQVKKSIESSMVDWEMRDLWC